MVEVRSSASSFKICSGDKHGSADKLTVKFGELWERVERVIMDGFIKDIDVARS